MRCPKCKKEIVIDPAGSRLWFCTQCQYAWKNEEIKAYWKGFEERATEHPVEQTGQDGGCSDCQVYHENNLPCVACGAKPPRSSH